VKCGWPSKSFAAALLSSVGARPAPAALTFTTDARGQDRQAGVTGL
jgi:hypothetical protein